METTTKKTTTVYSKPVISKSAFILDVNNGLSKLELTKKYGVSNASIKSIANGLGLTIKRSLVPKYTLVDDETIFLNSINKTESSFSLNN